MHICEDCGNLTEEITSSSNLQYKCTCGKIVDSNDEDTLITGMISSKTDELEKHKKYINKCLYFPQTSLVMKICPKCNIDGVCSDMRIGPEEKRYFKCFCGNVFS